MDTDRVTQVMIALQNIENVITILIDDPVEGVDTNELLRDYNLLRQEINKTLIQK